MPARKRAREEMEAEESVEEPSMLQKLRNMWQFSNLAQYIHLFADAIRIDRDFDIEELETECLKPQPSEKLAQIGLALLKHVSSHKGLTPEIFDEYTRRQFVAKAPSRNPFGTEELPNKFNDFDVFTKIRVLQQLSVWTLNNPNTIRERLDASEKDQTLWRIEPLGWDSQDRSLFVLDDNRLYRRTNPPPPLPPLKKKSKAKPKKSRGTRSSKRRKHSTPEPESLSEDEEVTMNEKEETEDDGLGGMKWECLCVTMEDYQAYMNGIKRSKDPNEKILYGRLEKEVLPEVATQAEEQERKQARKLRELQMMEKLATAKRSSRISARLEKQREVEEAEETERKRQAEVAMARAEQDKQRKMEEARDSRMITREQRLREREAKRILHEEELRKLEEDSERLESQEARLSERHLKAEMKRRQEELQKLSEEDESWVFDCERCGLHGENLDDGSHSIACEKCNVWQHSKCHNITEAQAERDDFHFICSSCARKEEQAKQPKAPTLKLRLTSASPNTQRGQANGTVSPVPRRLDSVQIPQRPPMTQPLPQPPQSVQPLLNGPSLSPRGQAHGPPGIQRSEAAYGSPSSRANGSPAAFQPRPYSAGQPSGVLAVNGCPTSSPPRYQTPGGPTSSFSNYTIPNPQQNGSPFGLPNPFRPAQNLPYGNSFSRPASSAGPSGPYQSPVKHSPAPSPRPSNGVPNAYNFTNSPHSSFPPRSTERPSFSPVKHSSPSPSMHHLSSPAPAPMPIAPSPPQMPAQMLPNPIPAPSKHDGVRPVSSHSVSETQVLPPVKSLSPSAPPQILSPPTKKMSPTPERPQFAPVSGNSFGIGPGFGGSQ